MWTRINYFQIHIRIGVLQLNAMWCHCYNWKKIIVLLSVNSTDGHAQTQTHVVLTFCWMDSPRIWHGCSPAPSGSWFGRKKTGQLVSGVVADSGWWCRWGQVTHGNRVGSHRNFAGSSQGPCSQLIHLQSKKNSQSEHGSWLSQMLSELRIILYIKNHGDKKTWTIHS